MKSFVPVAVLGLTLATATRVGLADRQQAPAAWSTGRSGHSGRRPVVAARRHRAVAAAADARPFRLSSVSSLLPRSLSAAAGIYSATCSACHGGDLRGGQLGGPNLLRSPVVLADDVVSRARADPEGLASRARHAGLPACRLTTSPRLVRTCTASSRRCADRDRRRQDHRSSCRSSSAIRTAGAAYFAAKCASCHSADGDLRGLATRVTEPRALQNMWVAGGGRGSVPSARRAS